MIVDFVRFFRAGRLRYVQKTRGCEHVNFTVIDKRTGQEPDLKKIALEEDWAKDLVYCDMDSFALMQDGTLLLLDECGRYACCPEDRFEIDVKR